MMPEPEANAAVRAAAETEPAPRAYRWYHKLWAAALVTLYLEVGFFLLVFSWTRYARNFAAFLPGLRPYWYNVYVRGAISALGALNLYIGLVEVFRLRRFRGRN